MRLQDLIRYISSSGNFVQKWNPKLYNVSKHHIRLKKHFKESRQHKLYPELLVFDQYMNAIQKVTPVRC